MVRLRKSLTFRPPYVRAVFSLRGMELSEGLRDITLPGRWPSPPGCSPTADPPLSKFAFAPPFLRSLFHCATPLDTDSMRCAALLRDCWTSSRVGTMMMLGMARTALVLKNGRWSLLPSMAESGEI